MSEGKYTRALKFIMGDDYKAPEGAQGGAKAGASNHGPSKVVDAVATGSSPTDVLLQMHAAVDIILEGFTGSERKRREHALNTIMTLMAVETIALRETMEELQGLKAAEIAAALKGSNAKITHGPEAKP